MRIAFAGTKYKKCFVGRCKKLFGMCCGIFKNDTFKVVRATNENQELCKVDFSKEDLQLEKIRYTLQLFGLSVLTGFICYNLSNDTGCSYIFSDDSVAEEWEKE